MVMTRQGKRTSVGPLAAHMDGFRSFALAWGYTTATTGAAGQADALDEHVDARDGLRRR